MWIVLLELKKLAHCHHSKNSHKIFKLKYLACFQTAFWAANHGSIFKTSLSVSMECPVGIKEFRTFNFLTVSHTLRGKIKRCWACYKFHTIMRPKIAITEEFKKLSVGNWPLWGHKGCYAPTWGLKTWSRLFASSFIL